MFPFITDLFFSWLPFTRFYINRLLFPFIHCLYFIYAHQIYDVFKITRHWKSKTGSLRVLRQMHTNYCRRQQEPAIVISRLLYITHASHVHSQHSLRMYGAHKKQFDHARSDLQLLVVWSARVLNICQVKSRQSTALEQLIMSLWTCDRCRPHSLTFGYY